MAKAETTGGLLHVPETLLTEFLLIALILVTLALEFLLHKLEKWVAMRHLHLQAVLRNLYRELMILGLVSFAFLTYEAIAHPDSVTVGSFELAHLFIFLLAMVHTAVVLVTVGASLSLSYRWRRMEQMELIHYMELKESYRRSRERRHAHHGLLWRRVQWWLPDPRTLARYWRLHEIMAFHDIRFQFLYYRDLPGDFNFSAYLRKVKAVVFIDLVDAHWSLWLVFLVLVIIDTIRRSYWDNTRFDAIFALSASGVLAVMATLLMNKISRIYWALSKHPATYFDHVSREEVKELGSARGERSIEISRRGRNNAGAATPASDADDEKTDGERKDTTTTTSRSSYDVPSRLATAELDDVQPVSLADGDGLAAERAPGGLTGMATEDGVEYVTTPATPQRLSIDAPVSTTRASFEAPRITNLVFSDNLEGGGEGAPDSKRGKRKQKRVNQPAPPSALDLEQVAEMHSLGRRSIDGVPGRASLDGKPRARRSLDGRPQPISRPSFDNRSSARRSLDGRPNGGSTSSEISGTNGGGGWVATRHAAGIEITEFVPETRPAHAHGAEFLVDSVRRSFERRDRNSLEGRRRSLESGDDGAGAGRVGGVAVGGGGRGIDMSSALPVEELADRADRGESGVTPSHVSLDIEPASAGEEGVSSARLFARSAREYRKTADTTRNPDTPRMNQSIVRHAEERSDAKELSPNGKYPKWVLFLCPRLRRVASRAEKLFWFGSHRFFMWLVEFTLFFSTVLFSAVVSAISIVALRDGSKAVDGLALAAFVISGAVLLYVLIRISYVMKKYAFVLNNASLVPEVLALQVIHNVRQKRQLMNEMYADVHDDASGSDSDKEGSEAARERRRKFSRFFATDAQKSGHIPGAADIGESGKMSVSKSVTKVTGLRRRRRRGPVPDIPAVPITSSPAAVESD